MTDLTIQIESQAIQAELARLQNVAVNMQPVMNVIGQDIRGFIDMGFRDLKSPDGINWAALSPVTIERRTNNSDVPLNDTGVLKNSFTVNATNNSVEVGTNAKQAAMMNFGGTKAQFPHLWGDIPARPFMPTSELPLRWEFFALLRINQYLNDDLPT